MNNEIKIWMIETTQTNCELELTSNLFFRTDEDPKNWIDSYKEKINDSKNEIGIPKEVSLSNVKHLISVYEFEELFSVNVDQLIKDKNNKEEGLEYVYN